MKFTSFKEFRYLTSTLDDVINYLRTDLTDIIRSLSTGLKQLKFSENFKSFVVTVEIDAKSEIYVDNQIKEGNGYIRPTMYIIVRRIKNSEYISDGDTQWTDNFLYLKNTHQTEKAKATLLFLV